MPPRDYLQEGDMDLLFAYLLELAAVPEVKRQSSYEVVSLSDPALQHRRRMPVFYYLSDEEMASAYVYLATYPPQPNRH
jgi:hypothetical protein